jgi:hypothetical protein
VHYKTCAALYQQTLKCCTLLIERTPDWPARQAAQGATKANHTTPQEAEKTPTLCLFERFERLTLGVTPSTALNTAASAGAGHGTPAAAPDSAATSSSAGSEQCVARLGPGRRSVAFGTPSVLTYTPVLPAKGSEEIGHVDEGTPLWSNAGVLSVSRAIKGASLPPPTAQSLGLRCKERPSHASVQCLAASLLTSGPSPTLLLISMPHIPAMHSLPYLQSPLPHTHVATHPTPRPGNTPYSLAGSSTYSGSRIQLATAEEDEEDSCCITEMPLITATGVQRARTGQQGGVRMELFTSVIREVPQEGAEVTPAVAGRPCWTPATELLAAAEGEQREQQGDSTDAAAAAGAGGLGAAGSEGDSGSECDMELQTPATLPFSARLQRAAVSTAGKGKADGRAPPPFHAGATGVGVSTAGKGKASSRAVLPFSAGAIASEVEPVGDARGSPSAGSTFTGFAGGASAEEAAGSATPTFFDGGRRGCAARTGNSGLQSLLAGGSSSTATSSDLTPPARACAGAAAPGRITRGQIHAGSSVLDSSTTPAAAARTTAAARAAAAAQTHIARLQGSRGAATPPTAPRQRTLQFAATGERTPAAAQRSLAAACAAAAAAATPATAPRRAAHSNAGSDAECTSAAAPSASGTADAEESFSSPPASTPMPAATPKSMLRQPERVAVEARM